MALGLTPRENPRVLHALGPPCPIMGLLELLRPAALKGHALCRCLSATSIDMMALVSSSGSFECLLDLTSHCRIETAADPELAPAGVIPVLLLPWLWSKQRKYSTRPPWGACAGTSLGTRTLLHIYRRSDVTEHSEMNAFCSAQTSAVHRSVSQSS